MKFKTNLLVILWIVTLAGYLFQWLSIVLAEDPYEVVGNNLAVALDFQDQSLKLLEDQLTGGSDHSNIEEDYTYPTQVFQNGKLIYWNSNDFLPSIEDAGSSDGIFFDPDTLFVIRRRAVTATDSSAYTMMSFLPVRTKYELNNKYLTNSFNNLIFRDYDVSLNSAGLNVLDEKIQLPVVIQASEDREVSKLILEALLVVTIIYSFWNLAIYIRRKVRNPLLFLSIVSAGLLLVRLGQLRFFPLSGWLSSGLFDSKVYISSWVFPSVGDLFINLSILLMLSLLTVQVFLKSKHIAGRIIATGWLRILMLVICTAGSFFSAALVLFTTTNLLENSQVSLDVSTSISFSWIRMFFFMMVLLTGTIYFHLNHLFIRYFSRIPAQFYLKLSLYLTIAVIFIAVFQPYAIAIVSIQGASWVILILLRPGFRFSGRRYITLFYLIFIALTIVSISSFAIYKHFEREDERSKERFANNLLLGNDIIAEHHLNEALAGIKADPFVRTRFLSRILVSNQTESRLSRHFPYYLEKYDINVYLFDANGDPYGANGSEPLNFWEDRYKLESFETSHTDIFFVDDVQGGRHKYIGFVSIKQFDNVVGHVVVELTLKKYIQKSVFPSLLVEASPQIDRSKYDYAIYNGNELQFSQGNFPFENEVDQKLLARLGRHGSIERGDIHYLSRELLDGRQLIIVSGLYRFSQIFSNISFQFILSLFIIGIVYIVMRWISPIHEYSLANKIQWYMGLAFVIPIFVVSLAILNVLNNSYREEINRNYQKRARNISEHIVNATGSFIENETNRDQYFSILDQAANLAQTDLMIYNRNGHLLGTNREEVFNLNLLSRQINPAALRYIKYQKGQTLVLDESIGELDFKTVYTGIYSFENGEFLGIVALPFFDFKNHLSRQQIEVFNNLLILFTAIFIVTVLIGNIGLKRLIAPINLIADRLKKINYLEDQSKPLHYEAKDEIGLLVREYNEMLGKLAESKEELAKVQKESAWKEIARQVAHEIKNPLTPMKLKIQQMQRLFQSETPEYLTLTSLLTQVDALATIADSFSAFAQMPVPENEIFNFSEVIESVISLHDLESLVLTKDLDQSINIYADHKLMSQILNNLIINAIQSIEKSNKEISISLSRSGKKALLSISDNGTGIPEDLRDKIFKPYFSTKEKGSGIGLALAKKGIEQAEGNIWFEANGMGGTTFFISLPAR